MNIDFQKFLEWAFMGVTSGALTLAVGFLRRISESVIKLNVQVGILLERSDGHAKILESHERRLSHLEQNGRINAGE